MPRYIPELDVIKHKRLANFQTITFFSSEKDTLVIVLVIR